MYTHKPGLRFEQKHRSQCTYETSQRIREDLFQVVVPLENIEGQQFRHISVPVYKNYVTLVFL